MWMLSGTFPIQFLNMKHTSRWSNLGFNISLAEKKKGTVYVLGSEHNPFLGLQLRCREMLQKRTKTEEHAVISDWSESVKQDINPLEDPWGLQPFPLDNSERRPVSSSLGRGLFILLGSNQGYGSLMVFMSLKVFHIWARSVLYGSPRRPRSQPLGLSRLRHPLAQMQRFSQWGCVIVKMPPFLTNRNFYYISFFSPWC